jgi:hypothetical protein
MDNYLSPRKRWVIVAVVCALSAAALMAGRKPSPRPLVPTPDSTKMKALISE